jgi:hypothetical protein
LPSCNRIDALRASIHAKNPIMQDANGTAAWLSLPQLIDEAITEERHEGFLKERRERASDSIRVHWGIDAAQYFRGVKTSKIGFWLPELEKAIMQAPQQGRTVVQFEGKDDYEHNKEYLGPCFPVMDKLAAEGAVVVGTVYDICQSLGGDYVALAECAGHCGHAHNWGCIFCEQRKELYGRIAVDETGRRVSVKAEKRTRKAVRGSPQALEGWARRVMPVLQRSFS